MNFKEFIMLKILLHITVVSKLAKSGSWVKISVRLYCAPNGVNFQLLVYISRLESITFYRDDEDACFVIFKSTVQDF